MAVGAFTRLHLHHALQFQSILITPEGNLDPLAVSPIALTSSPWQFQLASCHCVYLLCACRANAAVRLEGTAPSASIALHQRACVGWRVSVTGSVSIQFSPVAQACLTL